MLLCGNILVVKCEYYCFGQPSHKEFFPNNLVMFTFLEKKGSLFG